MILLERGKCLAQVIKERCFFLGLDDYVVNIDLDVSSDLLLKAVLHHALVSGTRVLEPEGHCCVAVDAKRRDECCFVFVFLLHPDLVVA